jgi:hypothetical protein
MFPPSAEVWETPTLLGPLGRSNHTQRFGLRLSCNGGGGGGRCAADILTEAITTAGSRTFCSVQEIIQLSIHYNELKGGNL